MDNSLARQLKEMDAALWIGVGAVAITTLFWLLKRAKEIAISYKCGIDVNKQSVEAKGEPGARISPLCKDGKLFTSLHENEQTLHETFMAGLGRSEGGPCLGWRPGPDQPYTWITYQQVLDRVKNFGSGILQEGAKANPDQLIGIFAQNRVEWKIVEQACNSYSMAIVPLYDTLGDEAIDHILNHCELRIVIVDNNKKTTILLNGVKEGKFEIDLIVVMDTISEEVKKLVPETPCKVVQMSDVEKTGEENPKDFVPPKPDDLHTICYTSGTTGLPKGAMLTHRNVVANFGGVFAMGNDSFLDLNHNDVHISYLPLAHMMERVISSLVYSVGGSVGFFQGDIKLLMNDVATLRPTLFPMVPRLINKFYDKVWARASESAIRGFLIKKATNAKLAKLRKGQVTRDSIWDKIVFSKIQDMVGGRARICITGAAPVSTDVINFMRASLGIPFSEGYGQTEATAAITLTLPGDYHSGSVGSPALCNMIKLVDVPEKNYFVAEGKGEVCVKGNNVFKGYYKDEEKTKQAFDDEGWLHTGDVGTWLPNGSLKIIDRKKHIFKLAQGEYIAPEKIEQVLVQSPAVAQVFVHGHSLKSSVVVVAIPDPETIERWCSSKGVSGSYEEICKSDKAKKLILEDLCAIGAKRGLKSFEIPRRIHLSSEMFSVENNLLTPTFKSRRPQLEARYKEAIDEMYQDLD